MRRSKFVPRAATWGWLAIAGVAAFAQGILRPATHAPASPGWPFGPPHSKVTLEGLLAHSDGTTLSMQLSDRRVIRYQLNPHTRYQAEGGSEDLSALQVSDLVSVESEVDSQGYLDARLVHFVR